MANLTSNREREERAAARSCGTCSLCCTVLRVDELQKPAGENCRHQLGVGSHANGRESAAQGSEDREGGGDLGPPGGGGCAIYQDRPHICRAYQCLWRQGGLEDDERPDATGGIVDLESVGIGLRLGIRMPSIDAFDASAKLRAIAERYRSEMPIRISDTRDVTNPDRPFRVLLPDGIEHYVSGDRIEIYRDGDQVAEKVLPWAERLGRRIMVAWRRRNLP